MFSYRTFGNAFGRGLTVVSDLPLESLSDEALVEEMVIDFKIKSTMLPTNLKNRNPMNITDLEKLTSKIGELRKTKPGDFASDSDLPVRSLLKQRISKFRGAMNSLIYKFVNM